MDVVDDWRSHLSASSRERILGKILETLKRVAPHRPEEFHAVESIARRFEGNVYNSATSQSDYLRRISLKMLTASSRSFRVNSSNTTTATTTTAASASTSATTIATAATATNTTTTDSNESRVTRSGRLPLLFFVPGQFTETPTCKKRKAGILEPESVKRRLSVMEFGVYLRKSGKKVEEADSICPVCLDCLKTTDEIRELASCSHVFHKGCLDMWIDKQRFSCPYCRADL
ncbi:uncharacterized RING finger protein P4H10.07-like [Papaver somniferum]|uniref:uncharacterized RING finger protein P4H10.07-like n=1 Tax=Papaver somniferum TaxID=3469 RepID=UPI000E7053E2|nr:uncharacterized RING finger protein P4H10.07-like [Papaver somniferum]